MEVLKEQICFLAVNQQQWRPSLVFDSFNALLEAFAKVAGGNEVASLRADALDDLVARRSANQPIDGKVALVLGQHTRVLWGDDAETEARDFFIHVVFLLKFYENDEDWRKALSQANQLIHLVPGQAPSSFGEKHLRFLKANNDDAWQPALIFDSFAHLQEALQSVLTTDKIKGFEKAQLAAMDSIMKRTMDGNSVDGNIAMTLEATDAEKRFLWSDEISDTREYSRHLCSALQENQDLASAVVTEAHKLFRVPAISFEIVNSFQAEVQLAPASPPIAHNNSEFEQDTPTVIASIDGTLNDEGGTVDFGSSDSHIEEEEETVESAPRKQPARGKQKKQTKKPPTKKKSAKKSVKTVAKKSVAKKVKATTAAQKKKPPKETTAVKSALKRSSTTPATAKRGSKKVQIDPKFRPDDTRMSPYSKSDVSILDDEKFMIPTSRDVLPILKKLGYKTAGSNFFRPKKNPKDRKEMEEGTDYFASISELRRFLCIRGVESKGFEIKDEDERKEEMAILQKWIRYSISPVLRNAVTVPKEARSPLVSIHKFLEQLGFDYNSAGFYFLPGVKPKNIGGLCINGFPMDKDCGIWAKLCRYGLPDTCDFKGLSNTDRIRLELYLSDCQYVDTFDFLEQVDEQFLESMKRPSTAETGSEVVSTTTPRPSASTTITPIATTGPNSAVGASSNCEGSTAGESVGATIVTNATGDISEQGDTMNESDCPGDKQAVESHVSNPAESAEKCTASAMRQLTRAGCSNNLSPQPAKELFKTTPPDVAEKKRKQQETSSAADTGEAQSGSQTAETSSTDEPMQSDTTPSPETGSSSKESGSVEKPSSQIESKLEGPADVTAPPTDGADETQDADQGDLGSANAVDEASDTEEPLQSPKDMAQQVESPIDVTAPPTDWADETQDAVQTDLGTANAVDEASVTEEPLQSPKDLVQQSESPAEGNAALADSPVKCIVETTAENPSPILSKFMDELEEDSAGVTGSPQVDVFFDSRDRFDFAPPLTQDPAISEFPSMSDEVQTESLNTSDSLLEPGEIDTSLSDGAAFASSSAETDAIPPPQETADEAALESDSKPIAKESMTSGPSQSTGEVANSRDETAFDVFVDALAGKVKPDDSWDDVWKKMRSCKVTTRRGTGLAEYEYVFPGRLPKSKGGILDYDFVDNVFGLKLVAFERCGWIGDEAFLAEKARQQTTHSSRGRSSPRQRSPSEVGKSETQSASTQGSLEQESSQTEVLGLASGAKRSPSKEAIAPVAKRQKEAPESANQASEKAHEEWIEALKQTVLPTDRWAEVEKMMLKGMTYSSGGQLVAWDYTFPGKKSRSEGGILGTDYVNDMYDLKVLAINHLGWLGDPKFFTEKAERESQGGRRRKRSAEVQVSTKNQRRKQVNVKEQLRCCQRDLQLTKKFKRLAIINNDKPSKFKDQVGRVQSFLLNALSTNGESSDRETVKPILYVCGAPGVGKTSAVKWCCGQAEQSVVKGNIEGVSDIRIAFVNATSTGDAKGALKEIKDALDIPGQQMTVSSFKNYLKKTKDSVVLVIDEVDHMVSTRPNDSTNKTTKEKLLQELCTIASNPEHAFVLIGLSNAVGATEVKKLKSIGMGDEKVPFAPYSKDDLIELVAARVGLTTIDEKALRFLASKVSSGSGDARSMLELVSSAVEKCKTSLTVAQLDAAMEQPVVTIRHAMQAVKDSTWKVAERIESLPETQKLVLCVAVTACKALPDANFRMAELREYINAVIKEDGELETMDNDDFLTAIQNLVDQGMLLPNDDGQTDIRAKGLGAFRETQVRFGHQLEDVESIVDQRLSEKPVYGRLMEAIRQRPPLQE